LPSSNVPANFITSLFIALLTTGATFFSGYLLPPILTSFLILVMLSVLVMAIMLKKWILFYINFLLQLTITVSLYNHSDGLISETVWIIASIILAISSVVSFLKYKHPHWFKSL
jgi:hypothetical protein